MLLSKVKRNGQDSYKYRYVDALFTAGHWCATAGAHGRWASTNTVEASSSAHRTAHFDAVRREGGTVECECESNGSYLKVIVPGQDANEKMKGKENYSYIENCISLL